MADEVIIQTFSKEPVPVPDFAAQAAANALAARTAEASAVAAAQAAGAIRDQVEDIAGNIGEGGTGTPGAEELNAQ